MCRTYCFGWSSYFVEKMMAAQLASFLVLFRTFLAAEVGRFHLWSMIPKVVGTSE